MMITRKACNKTYSLFGLHLSHCKRKKWASQCTFVWSILIVTCPKRMLELFQTVKQTSFYLVSVALYNLNLIATSQKLFLDMKQLLAGEERMEWGSCLCLPYLIFHQDASSQLCFCTFCLGHWQAFGVSFYFNILWLVSFKKVLF